MMDYVNIFFKFFSVAFENNPPLNMMHYIHRHIGQSQVALELL